MHQVVNGGTILTVLFFFFPECSLLTAHTHSSLVLFISIPCPCDFYDPGNLDREQNFKKVQHEIDCKIIYSIMYSIELYCAYNKYR